MKCSNCGTQLPPGAVAWPMCGTPTPQYGFGSGATPYDPTVASSYNTPDTPLSATPPPPTYDPTPPAGPYGASPSTAYGSQSYSAPPPPQYMAPYVAPPPPQYTFAQPPPPSPGRSQGKRIAIITGVALLILILLGAGLFALLRPGSSNTTVTSTPTPAVHTTPQPTATANSSQNPYPPNTGTLVLNDPLTDNSRGYKWDESSFSGTDSCGFTNGAYHIVEKTGLICIPEAKDLVLSNFAFEANIKIVKGDDGGIGFRINQVNKTFYDFDITTGGSYTLKVYTGKYTTLSEGSNSVINKGLNQSNLVAVVANNDLITIYVNNQIIDSVHDKNFSQGQIGVLSLGGNGPTDVIASNARAWKL